MSLVEHRRRLDALLARRDHARRRVAEEKATLKEARAKQSAAEGAKTIVQAVAAEVQKSAHAQVAAVVTRCLKTVFGEGAYDFTIRFDKKRGKTEARLLFVRDGKEIDPCDAAGGGVIDVASFALRLAALLLSRPRKRKLLLLDEPFKHLSACYRPAVRELVETLAREMGLQFVLVSHSEALEMGKVIRIGGGG